MLLVDVTGDYYRGGPEVVSWYARIAKIINRASGDEVFSEEFANYDPIDSMQRYIRTERDSNKVLDAVELLFGDLAQVPEPHWPSDGPQPTRPTARAAITTLNGFFQQHALRFRFESGKIIRIDSHVAHAEIVHPAMMLLADPRYAGANEEYLKAHEHYRHCDYAACVVECRKAFESVMKIICLKRQWVWKEPAGAAPAAATGRVHHRW